MPAGQGAWLTALPDAKQSSADSFLPNPQLTISGLCRARHERTVMKNHVTATHTVSKVLFPMGQTLATPGALRIMAQFGFLPADLLSRHTRGDFGVVCSEDAQANAEAIIQGSRILSSYLVGSQRIWVITEADRSTTTILLPDEY